MYKYRSISNLNDGLRLQLDINAIVDWCELNKLQLNIKKCQSFTFYRTSAVILFNYEIKSIILTRLVFIKDLGVFLERKLSFHDHIDAIISKSMAMLAFLKRNSSEFSDPYTLRSLYVSLVRPHLEYCAILWNPVYSSHCPRIERVQKNFTRYVFY